MACARGDGCVECMWCTANGEALTVGHVAAAPSAEAFAGAHAAVIMGTDSDLEHQSEADEGVQIWQKKEVLRWVTASVWGHLQPNRCTHPAEYLLPQ